MSHEPMLELPPSIAALRGRICDVDSHENVPLNLWCEEFGSVMSDFVEAINQSGLPNAAQKTIDDSEINTYNVNHLKFEKAPGAFDFKRRLEVMDFVGLDNQLMYPGGLGIYAMGLYNRADDKTYLRTITGDRKNYARQLIRAYNDWCTRIYRGSNRLRAVAMLAEDTVDNLIAAAKEFIAKGVGGLWIPTDRPPGDLSPAAPELDPFWALLAESNTPILAHIGAEVNAGPLKTLVWRDAPAFEGWMVGREFSLDPWTMTNMHLGTQVYLMTMVLGGVFERHPKLRFGSAEFCGHWIGPLAENMDRFFSKGRMAQAVGKVLKEKPSEYVRRNVRVACFDFEPVGAYIDRYGLEEVYCYASDYPHVEGGTDPIGNFEKSLTSQSDAVREKFYVENSKLLMPN
jgi:predicted TIM-barrel fold metal-dependent hydrolase